MSTKITGKFDDGSAIAGRLRKMYEAIDREAAALYRTRGIEFEQRWFGTVNLLLEHEALGVTQIAEALGITHASVSETKKSLLANGIVTAGRDPDDGRRQLLSLSPKGKKLAALLDPLWEQLNRVGEELDREAGGVIAALDRLGSALERSSLSDRVGKLPEPDGRGA